MHMHGSPDDGELIRRLRAGDSSVLEMLWNRHQGPALRYARRVLGHSGEDAVSEAFLLVTTTIMRGEKGPRDEFLPYLLTVIRNLALQWRRDAGRVMTMEDIDLENPVDGSILAEERAEDALLRSAFAALPERWRRVLFMSEVQELPRADIARSLEIRLNAVSALKRRAQRGLHQQWLLLQIPRDLLNDDTHVARLLPQYLADPRQTLRLSAVVATHVTACEGCRTLLSSLRVAPARRQRRTLVLALTGASGLIARSAFTPTTQAVATGLSTVGAKALVAVGSTVAITATAVALSMSPVDIEVEPPKPAVSSDSVRGYEEVSQQSSPVLAPPLPTSPPAPDPSPPTPADDSEKLPPEDAVDTLVLKLDPSSMEPVILPPPEKVETPTPEPDPSHNDEVWTTLRTPQNMTGFFAPVIEGAHAPDSKTLVSSYGQTYTTDDTGAGGWSFDVRRLALGSGAHSIDVWSVRAGQPSAVVPVQFTVLPLKVEGFEAFTGFEDLTLKQAQTSGAVFTVQGPPDALVLISSMRGQTGSIRLDAAGYARARLKMTTAGWYYLSIRALDGDGVAGAAVEQAIDVTDPDLVFEPWGGSDMTDFQLELVS